MFIFTTDQELWARELNESYYELWSLSMLKEYTFKFILLFYDSIWVQQCYHFKFNYLLFELKSTREFI
jgi:hypothetical protein